MDPRNCEYMVYDQYGSWGHRQKQCSRRWKETREIDGLERRFCRQHVAMATGIFVVTRPQPRFLFTFDIEGTFSATGTAADVEKIRERIQRIFVGVNAERYGYGLRADMTEPHLVDTSGPRNEKELSAWRTGTTEPA